MADMELQQVRIRLTADKEVIAELHSRRRFQKDEQGKFFIPVMFNSQEIRFHLNDVKTLGRDTAHALRRREFVIMPLDGRRDDLSGKYKSIFDIVEEFDLSERITAPKFACPECGKDQKDGRGLAEHLATHFVEPVVEDDEDHTESEPEPVEAAPAKTRYFNRKASERTVAE